MFFHEDVVLPSVSKIRSAWSSLKNINVTNYFCRCICRRVCHHERKWSEFHAENWICTRIYTFSVLHIHSVVGGRINEAMRVAKSFSSQRKQVYVYIRYVYTDSLKYLSDVSLNSSSTCGCKMKHSLLLALCQKFRTIFWWYFKWPRTWELMEWFYGEVHLILIRGEFAEIFELCKLTTIAFIRLQEEMWGIWKIFERKYGTNCTIVCIRWYFSENICLIQQNAQS